MWPMGLLFSLDRIQNRYGYKTDTTPVCREQFRPHSNGFGLSFGLVYIFLACSDTFPREELTSQNNVQSMKILLTKVFNMNNILQSLQKCDLQQNLKIFTLLNFFILNIRSNIFMSV